jgi:aminoglycoside phosphotransferase family enzyme
LVTTSEKLRYLQQSSTYPDKPRGIDMVETHMSWVFLTDQYAYKLKKPVRYAFLDFSTLAARQRTCQEEVRLNRRLARDVYLGVVPLVRRSDATLELDASGRCVDWLVKMRRLPAEQMLDCALREKRVGMADVRKFSGFLADFYRHSQPVQMAPTDYLRRFERDISENVIDLRTPRYGLPSELIADCARLQAEFLRTGSELLAARARTGKIIEAHGDLRPEHICIGPEPRIIDCMEFKRDLRLLDPVDELAFLTMECDRLGEPWIGRVVTDTYSAVCGDRSPEALINFYKGYRACLRAKIAVWHTEEANETSAQQWRTLAIRYLALSVEYLSLALPK